VISVAGLAVDYGAHVAVDVIVTREHEFGGTEDECQLNDDLPPRLRLSQMRRE